MTDHNLGLRYDTTVWVYRELKINSISSRLNSFHIEFDECFEQSISLQKTITPINQVKPGDWIYSFDGCIHKVERVNAFLYDGQIVGLNHNLSDKTLWLIETTTIPSRKQTKLPKSLNDWSEIPRNMTELRKYLRNNPTRAEQHLWSALSNKKLGYKFRRQHSIGPYIVDFYSRDGNIVVEVDGAGHFTSSGIEYDLERNQFIGSLGL